MIADVAGFLDMAAPATRLRLFVTPLVEQRKLSRPSGDRTLGEHAREAFSRFDAKQPSAIVAYLEWRLRKDGFHPVIEQALEAFWLAREAAMAGHP
jgi:hypothetical protein